MKHDLPTPTNKTNPKSSQPDNSHTKENRVITTEQFNEIVGAIIEGKYSWACFLMLSFAGCNPLHYIPYRTYNRLLKENCQCKNKDQEKNN